MNYRMLAVAATALLTTSAAHAGLTFDTITNQSPDFYSGAADSTSTAAASFTVAGTPNFNSFTLSLLADNPADNGSVMVYLAPDDGSGPGVGKAVDFDPNTLISVGTVLDSSLGDTGSGNPTLVKLGGVTNTLAPTPNNEYWVVLDLSNSSAEWVYNADGSGVGTAGQESYSDANGLYPDDGSAGPGAFEMIVDAPEPTTLALLGGGLAGLGCVRRRNAKKR